MGQTNCHRCERSKSRHDGEYHDTSNERIGTADETGLLESVEPTPRYPTMVVRFETVEGSSVDISFTHRPLGIDFDMRAPIVITEVTPNSFAEQRGVRTGWKIKSVNGEHFSADKGFQFQYDVLKMISNQLPESKGKSLSLPQIQQALMGA
eukprot:gnl/TRDRNA2_/TRDRNA2_44135_c0_seq1.p1 gnl/TRDRNA2_/TRDRNA2_44135_c0~~gnl/TRDRNA2_/TRDRNA2_44135_c0_seq1.p1  ORF type:complete len:151 (-),score=14.14 gnl/TRDRNA2_/TRDRNA2_44135_c0_seq1:29-481(-)